MSGIKPESKHAPYRKRILVPLWTIQLGFAMVQCVFGILILAYVVSLSLSASGFSTLCWNNSFSPTNSLPDLYLLTNLVMMHTPTCSAKFSMPSSASSTWSTLSWSSSTSLNLIATACQRLLSNETPSLGLSSRWFLPSWLLRARNFSRVSLLDFCSSFRSVCWSMPSA